MQVQEEGKEEEDILQVMYEGELRDIPCSLENDSVLDLKRHIENVLGLEASQFRLELDDKDLPDERWLEDLQMEEDMHIQVIAGLFAQMANYSRVAFAIDLSGSMSAGVGNGQTQISVVRDHLIRCMRSLRREGCCFGLSTFTATSGLPLGSSMIDVSRLQEGIDCVQNFRAGGNNGGEATCLSNLINMDPEVIFFLGDGGWNGSSLIRQAKVAASCNITIHSIAFYLQGSGNSGLPEIARMTGGTYRNVTKMSDYRQ